MKIAVLSTNKNLYSTQRLVQAALERGHECVVLDHRQCYVGIREDKPSIHYKGQDITDIDAIIPRIGASVTFYGSAIVRQFEVMNVISANNSQAITRSRDKLRCMQILSGAGLGLPITGFARSASDVDDLINMVGGAPLVIKLLEGTQGIGVVLAETKKSCFIRNRSFLRLRKQHSDSRVHQRSERNGYSCIRRRRKSCRCYETYS